MAPRLQVTDDEYDLLTEEERIGLKEFQAEFEAEQAAENAAIAAAANGDPEDEAEPEPEKQPEKKAKPVEEEGADEEEEGAAGEGEQDEGEEGEEGEGEGEEEGAGEGDDDDEDDQPVRVTPPPAQRLSEAEEKRLVAIKAELKAVAQKFDDGDITAVEMREQQETLEDERDALREKRSLAAMSTQTAINTWYYTTIPTFMAQHTEYKEGSLRYKLLDTIVKEMQVAATNPTDPKILFDAHAKVEAEFGAVEPKKGKKKPANGNGQEKRVTPPNLGSIPASDQQQVTPICRGLEGCCQRRFVREKLLRSVTSSSCASSTSQDQPPSCRSSPICRSEVWSTG